MGATLGKNHETVLTDAKGNTAKWRNRHGSPVGRLWPYRARLGLKWPTQGRADAHLTEARARGV